MSTQHNLSGEQTAGGEQSIPVQVSYSEPLKHNSPARQAIQRYTRQVLTADALAITAASLGGAGLRFPSQSPSRIVLLHIPVVVCIWLAVLAARSAYSREGLHSIRVQNRVIISSALITYPFVSMFSYTFKNYLSRGFLIFTMLLGLMLMTLVRTLMWQRFKHSNGLSMSAQRTLLVGSPTASKSGNLADLMTVSTLASPGPGDFEQWLARLLQIVAADQIDVVLLAPDHTLSQSRLQRLAWALEGGVDLVTQVGVGNLGRRAFLRVDHGQAYLHLTEIGLTGPKRLVKRVFDICIAVAALILLSPVFLLTMLAIKFTSPGPVFFVQPRVGQYGHLFPFPKFRSMKVGAHKERATTLGSPDDDMIHRYRNDPRITRVGRVIRRLSIDELPQIWAVLRGDMSIVGPRPVLEEELHLLTAGDHRRHAAKPGLTGLWQVSGRKEVPWDQRMAMDVEYLENWSLARDIFLIIRTIGAIATGRGAH